MNKTLKGIIGGSALLAVLGGVLVVLKLTEKEPAADSSSEAEVVMLWHANSDDISKITVEPSDGESFSAVRRMDKTKTTDLNGTAIEQDIANYYLTGYEDLPMDTTGIRLLALRAPELAAVDVILEHASKEDMARFGLDHPTRVTYEVDNADPISFLIGDATQVDSNYYLCMDGGDTVYTVESTAMDPFLKKPEEFLGKQVTEELDPDTDLIVNSVQIERKNLDYAIDLEYDSSISGSDRSGSMAQHVMTSPIYCLLSPDKSSDATHGIYGLSADDIVTPHPTEADKKKCGLDDPFASVTVKTNDGKTTTFLLGDTYETEDGKTYYYGMLSSVNCIYGFSADATIYDDVVPSSISSKNILDLYVWDVSHLVCEAGGKKLEFEGEGTDADDFVLTLNGKKYENTERYRQFYSFLLQTKAEDLIIEEIETPAESKRIAALTVEKSDGKRSYQIDFYDAEGMKAYIAINGRITFRCRKSYVDVLQHNIEIFEDDSEEFTTRW